MLDFNLSADEFWIEFQALKQKLSEFSNLSLIEPQQEKQNFLEQIYCFLSQLEWDSIGGGCYIIKENSFTLSIEHHGLLAEFLMAAGLVFSEGEFIYRGELLVKAFNNYLFDQEKKMFINQISFNQENAPFILTVKNIKKILTLEELTLLITLMGYNNLDEHKSYWIKYIFPLNIAAEKANIHYKKAQILEHTLREKLKSLSTELYCKSNPHVEVSIEANTQMISLLTQLVTWHKKTDYTEQLNSLASNMISYLSEASIHTNRMALICYALLDYCQVNFKKELVSQIYKKLTLLEPKKINSKKYQLLTYQSSKIIEQLGLSQESISENFFYNNQLPNIKVVQLLESKVESEIQKQKLFSCYDPWLKVYQTHE